MEPIDVLIVSCCAAVGRRLQACVRADPGLRLQACVSELHRVVRLLRQQHPDVAVWEVGSDADRGGGLASAALLSACNACRVLVCAPRVTESLMLRLVALGGWGCVAQSELDRDLARAIHAIAHGEFWLTRAVLSRALVELNRLHGSHDGVQALLSEREREIMVWAAHGLMNKEIAQRLGISDLTVKTHLQRVFKKMAVHHRSQLAWQVADADDAHA